MSPGRPACADGGCSGYADFASPFDAASSPKEGRTGEAIVRLLSVRQEGSTDDRVRLVGRVEYDDRPGRSEDLWWEVPGSHAESLTSSGNPWLVGLTPLASFLGEPLVLPLTVDGLLLRGLGELMAVWQAWFSTMRAVPLLAEAVRDTKVAEGARRTGLFISGGVDSLFSLFHNDRHDPGTLPVDELIAVHGFDIPLDREAEFERHCRSLRNVAAAAGKSLVTVRTNLRDTRFGQVPWGTVAHGCGLVAAGLSLESRFRRLLVASTNPYLRLTPWGSHPLTDPLLSTEQTRVVHDGAGLRRWEKLEFLAGFDAALQALHVCYKDRSDANCGRCEKCLRNMIILEILGVLGRCPSFPGGALDLETVSRILVKEDWQPEFYEELRKFAVSRGRPDVAEALERCLSRSRFQRRLLRLAMSLRDRVGLWRFGRFIRRNLFARAVS
jgi:hypothetical protein